MGCLLLMCCPCAFALDPSLDVSQYTHTAWRIREGFPKARISAFAQTSDGYLWIGTDLGLVRYDGVKAVPWQPPGQPLPDTFIRSLLVARDGALWIGTLKGLVSWKNGKLTSYKELAGLSVDDLLEDRQGTLWVGTAGLPNGKLCAIQGGTVDCHGEKGGFGGWVESLYEDRAGNLWAAAATGLWRWKPGPPKRYPIPYLVGTSRSLLEGNDGALLIGSHDGIKQLVNGRMKKYSVPGRRAFVLERLLLDHDGGLWIGTNAQGLVHVHQGRADVFTKADGLSGDSIESLFEDREGNVWVATNGGLDRFRQLPVTTLDSSQGLSNSDTNAVLADRDGSIWIATSGGLNRWSNGRIMPVRVAGPRPAGKNNAFTPIALFQDDRGRIWVSTRDAFGYLEKDQFAPLSGFPGDAVVRSIAQDNAGNIWIAYNRFALFRVSRSDEVEQIPVTKLGHEDIATALASDPFRGGLWVGFFNGGLVYFQDGQVRASYTAADGLGQGFVQDIRISPDGTLWASTQGGLSRLKNGRIATLSSRNGLPCDAVHWSREDDAGSVWLYTPCGLVHFPRSELDRWATAVDRDKNSKQGVLAAVLTDGVSAFAYPVGLSPIVAKSSNGKFWFVVPGGVSVFDPRHLPSNKLPPPVHVEQIIADRNVSWQNSSGDASASVRLPAEVRDLEIDYTALSFVEPEKVHFRYKLEGWDREWQWVGNRRQAFYANLSPGNYRFRVAASNNSGVWNEEGASLDFSVAPAYYQTWWFRFSCVIAFTAMLWGLYRLRLRQMAQQFNVRMEERLGERMRIARDLHDTLLQSFHGLLLRFQTGINQLPEHPVEARRRLESALDQAAQAITEGRDAVQGLRSSTAQTNDLALAIKAIGEEVSADATNGNSIEFHVQMEGTPRNLHPILRDEVYRIAGEALRNAFQHAQARHIEVEIRYDERQLRLRIRDDGRGIDPKVLKKGERAGHYGLQGMHERAKLLGGNLTVWSEVDSGAEVELSIPASHAYEKSSTSRRSWLTEKLTEKFSRKYTAMKS